MNRFAHFVQTYRLEVYNYKTYNFLFDCDNKPINKMTIHKRATTILGYKNVELINETVQMP